MLLERPWLKTQRKMEGRVREKERDRERKEKKSEGFFPTFGTFFTT
jgi:hypothetical protein